MSDDENLRNWLTDTRWARSEDLNGAQGKAASGGQAASGRRRRRCEQSCVSSAAEAAKRPLAGRPKELVSEQASGRQRQVRTHGQSLGEARRTEAASLIAGKNREVKNERADVGTGRR